MSEHLLDFALTWAALALPALVCASLLNERTWCERSLVLLGGFAGVALAGYVAFWAWLARPVFGRAWTAVVMAAAAGMTWRRRRQVLATLRDDDVWIPLLLALLVGVLYIALLHLYRADFSLDILSRLRYMPAMPGDNELPRRFADLLIFGIHPHRLFNEWLSSDRPPLQVGLILLNAPIARAIGAPMTTAAHAAGIWFQLFWLPAMWALLRRLGFEIRQTAALAAVTAITSLTLFHSVFLWPKLGGAAFAIGAFVLYARPQARGVATLTGVAAFSALAWLSHGGTVFSLLALGIMGLFWKPRPSLGAAAAGLLTFAVLALPWTAYQTWYDPPGNRLVKWHLAGVVDIDQRGVLQTMKDQYLAAGWLGTIANKRKNFVMLFQGFDEPTFAVDRSLERRIPEWFFFFRSLSVWNVALLAAPIVLVRRKKHAGFSASMTRATAIWSALSLVTWCLVFFGPPTWTVNHAGSFAANLSVFALAYALAWRVSPWLLAALAAISVCWSAVTWIPATQDLAGTPLSPAAIAVSILSAVAIGAFLSWCWRTRAGTAPRTQ